MNNNTECNDLMQWRFWFLLFGLILSGCQPIIAPFADKIESTPSPNRNEAPTVNTPLTLTPLTLTRVEQGLPTRYASVEFRIEGFAEVRNPFDAAEADLQITLGGPSGENITVGGFWYQAYTPDGLQREGEAGWRARFTPTVSGEWRARALLQPSDLTSNEVRFVVEEGSAAGFVRIDAENPRYFAYDDGTRFLPLGVNMGWWDDDPIQDYTRWLDHFADNGGNTIRVWMANWAYALEWNDTPLGDYRARLRQAWLLDELLRLADERGVKVILVLNHHGQFSKTVNPQWDENPYNAALGGPLEAPEQFATDPAAMALFQQRLRYIVDRWGSAPNLLAWEWWNEFNFTPISDAQMEGWLVSMNKFLAARDPYDHLVTISGPAGATSPIWQLPGIDFVSVHIYRTDDLLPVASELTEEYAPEVPEKPLLLAEFGYATGTEGIDSHDQTGIHLHNGLWATLFSGQAGSGMYWWWDIYLEPLGLWHHFGELSAFLAGFDLAEFAPAALSVVTDQAKAAGAEGLLLKGEDGESFLLWVRSNQYTAAAVEEAYNVAVRNALRNKEKLLDFVYEPTPVSGHHLVLDDAADGEYEVRWFDPQTGIWRETEQVEAVDGNLSIPLPTFSQDIAAEIHLIR